jgi:hypothetical protein
MLLSLVPLAVIAGGCGGDGGADEPTTPAEATTDQTTTRENVPELGTAVPDVEKVPRSRVKKRAKMGAAKFRGVHRDNYENARAVCGAFPRRKVARDLGLDTSEPGAIAEAYAKGFRPAFRQANFEGCLDGLR